MFAIPHLHTLTRSLLQLFDRSFYLIILLALAFYLGHVARRLLRYVALKLLQRHPVRWLQTVVAHHLIRQLSMIVPPLIISLLLPLVYPYDDHFFLLLEKLASIYLVMTVAVMLSKMLESAEDWLNGTDMSHAKSLKSAVQLLQVVIFAVAFIVVLAFLMRRSPMSLITGLGAFTALIVLLFRDVILGFVSGVLLSMNGMLKLGDWIEVPGTCVYGIVEDVSLTTVKVRNFDNTLVMVPPYNLLTKNFVNWQAMRESTGRRVMLELYIDPESVMVSSDSLLQTITSASAAFKEYLLSQPTTIADTNLGLFRAYANMYLHNHPKLLTTNRMQAMVLTPTPYGIPLHIFCYSTEKRFDTFWPVNSEIVEHLTAMMPFFQLKFNVRNSIVSQYSQPSQALL